MSKGDMMIGGVQAFCDLFTPGGAPGFAPKFSSTLLVQKGGPFEATLFQTMADVAMNVWGSLADERLTAIHGDILGGVEPNHSRCNVLDGDQYQPDYNAGFWVVKATRRLDKGPPFVFGIDGEPVHDVRDKRCPQPGWGVMALINIWAQKQRDRLNFTLVSVRAVQQGIKAGGPPPAQIEASIQDFLAAPVPQQIPGVLAPQAQLGAGQPAQAPQMPARAAIPSAPGPSIPGRPAAPAQAASVPVSPAPAARRSVPAGPPAAKLGLGEPQGDSKGNGAPGESGQGQLLDL